MSIILPVRWVPEPSNPDLSAGFEINIINCMIRNLYRMGTGDMQKYNLSISESVEESRNLVANIYYCDIQEGYSAIFGGHSGVQTPQLDIISVAYEGVRWTYLSSPTYVTNDKQKAALPNASFGTSQYTTDSYPIPTDNVLTVGNDTETYSTVWAAYQAASDGDNIVISSNGSPYTENNFNNGVGQIDKSVSFWGATQNPADVVLQMTTSGSSFFYYKLKSRPEAWWGHVPGVYHLTIQTNPGGIWSSPFRAINQ